MTCDEALLAISAALDGELPGEERIKLSEHLFACPDCRELAEDLRVLTDELELCDQAPPETLSRSIRKAVAKDRTRAKKRPPYLRAAAAMLALCVLLGGAGLFAHSGMRMKSAGGADNGASPRMGSAPGGMADSVPYGGEGAPVPCEEAAPQDAEEPVLPMPSSAPEPAPNPESAGGGPTSADGGGSSPSMVGTAATPNKDINGADAPLITQEDAEALARDFYGDSMDKEEELWTLTYLDLSPNGRYYLFEVRLAQSGTYRTTLAVALDGGEVLDQQSDGYEADVEQ